MDFTSIGGILLGLVLITLGIMDGGKIMDFIDPASFMITLGGTFSAVIASYPISAFKYIPKHFGIIIQKKKYDPKKYIETIVSYAQDARRKGILVLEDRVEEQKDEFVKKSVMLIVDAIEPEKAKQILENELDCLDARHSAGWGMYERASAFCPAFGMVGTLIGLINMLKNLNMQDENAASQIGVGMSVALITTFYGSLFANLIFTPMANKLRARHAEEMLCKEIIVEGVIAIQAGDNPKHIEERLMSFLDSTSRNSKSKGKTSGNE